MSTFYGRAAIAKPLITESNAQMLKRWYHDHKTRTSDNWKRARDMVRRVALHAVSSIRKNLRLENTQRSLHSGLPGPHSETRGRFCYGLDSSVTVQYSVAPIITLYSRITAREYVDGLGNQVHLMGQTSFSNNDTVFQDDSAPLTQLKFTIFLGQHSHQI
jgi:hypothetical protein